MAHTEQFVETLPRTERDECDMVRIGVRGEYKGELLTCAGLFPKDRWDEMPNDSKAQAFVALEKAWATYDVRMKAYRNEIALRLPR